jgi:Ca2+/Na+ antiporter
MGFIFYLTHKNKKGEFNNMNKKNVLIKIVEFIHNANIKYKKSNSGDMAMIILFVFVLAFGKTTTLIVMVLAFALRAVYEFDILKRLGVINEEENNKKNDEQNFENIR